MCWTYEYSCYACEFLHRSPFPGRCGMINSNVPDELTNSRDYNIVGECGWHLSRPEWHRTLRINPKDCLRCRGMVAADQTKAMLPNNVVPLDYLWLRESPPPEPRSESLAQKGPTSAGADTLTSTSNDRFAKPTRTNTEDSGASTKSERGRTASAIVTKDCDLIVQDWTTSAGTVLPTLTNDGSITLPFTPSGGNAGSCTEEDRGGMDSSIRMSSGKTVSQTKKNSDANDGCKKKAKNRERSESPATNDEEAKDFRDRSDFRASKNGHGTANGKRPV